MKAHRYHVALGSNLPGQGGESPKNNVVSAMDSLTAQGFDGFERSDLYETAPVPVSDQPWYVNAVVAYDSSLAPLEMLALLNGIEDEFGRVRSARNAARILDLDIIAIESADAQVRVIDSERLTVPHPRMHQRAFVLDPLKDVAPDWHHPVMGQSISQLRAALG